MGGSNSTERGGDGGSAVRLEQAARDLSRRLIVHRLPEMSFREYLDLTWGLELPPLTLNELTADHPLLARRVIEALAVDGRRILPAFEHFLRVGAYPFHLDFDDRSLFYRAVAQAMRTAIEVDQLAVNKRKTPAGSKTDESLIVTVRQVVRP